MLFSDISDYRFVVCIYQARICFKTWYETYDQWQRSTFNARLIQLSHGSQMKLIYLIQFLEQIINYLCIHVKIIFLL